VKEHLPAVHHAFLSALLATALVACNGGAYLLSGDGSDQQSEFQFSGAEAARSYRLQYLLPDQNGSSANRSAVVLVPGGEVPDDGWPIIGWSHAFTGIAPVCAPSNHADLAGSAGYLDRWLTAGYAVVAADYATSHNGASHYLDPKFSGLSVMLAIQAAVEHDDALSSRYITVGQGQGGHAALAAAAQHDAASELDLLGVVAMAPPTQLRELLDAKLQVFGDESRTLDARVQAAESYLIQSVLLLQAAEDSSASFSIAEYFGDDAGQLLNAAQFRCAAAIEEAASAQVAGNLLIHGNIESLIDSTVYDHGLVIDYLNSIEAGDLSIQVPVLLQQGENDSLVTPAATASLQTRLADSNGDMPLLIEYQADHHSIREAGFADALTFADGRFD